MMGLRNIVTAKEVNGNTHVAINPASPPLSLPEIRCPRCHRLLMKGEVKRVEIKCPKCGCLLSLPKAPYCR
ncbi:MAG: Com family DNA-binding transcriptional regulator [Syntrophaceae bacterium]|nr:Com family DNA-binding transcriptional regulator [Syntrophaceae bacterium]